VPHPTCRLWAKLNGRDVGCVSFVPDRLGHGAMPIPTAATTQASNGRKVLATKV
jgi:hypothetical protein